MLGPGAEGAGASFVCCVACDPRDSEVAFSVLGLGPKTQGSRWPSVSVPGAQAAGLRFRGGPVSEGAVMLRYCCWAPAARKRGCLPVAGPSFRTATVCRPG